MGVQINAEMQLRSKNSRGNAEMSLMDAPAGVTKPHQEMTTDEAIGKVERPLKMVLLERSLAYENASSFLDCNCPPRDDETGDWLDTAEDCFGEDELSCVTEAVTYLEWRGLLERHATNVTWVRVLDED